MTEVNVQTRVYIMWDYELGDTVDFSDPSCEITQYRQSVDIRIGSQAGQRVARVGTCAITLLNADRLFSPRYLSGAYVGKLLPMKPVLVTATDGVDTWTVFSGWTKKITPQPDKWKERKAKIDCVDWLGWIQASDIDIPLREDVLSSQLVTDVLNYALKATIATSVYSVTGTPSDGDTVGINGTTYRFKTTPAQANDVQISSAANGARLPTIAACVAAINGWDGEGTDYFLGTTRPADVRARVNDSYVQIVLDDAPTRYYRIGDAAGTAFDIGSNLKDATINGSPTLGVTGAITNDTNKAIRLDGVNDYVSIPTLDFAERSFSIEFWFKPAASPPANQDLFSIHTAFSADQAFYIRYANTTVLSAYFYSGAQVDSGLLALGSWHHIVVTYDYSSSTLRLYTNGVLADTQTSAGPLSGTSPTIQLGAYTAAGANYTKGDMDEAALWLRVISEDEVADHYAAATAAPSPGFTIFSLLRGAIGNAYTSTKSSSAITVSGATLSGGTDTPNMTTAIQTGLRRFPYAADDWGGERVDALKALQAIAESERGRFYVKRDGTAVFENYAKEFEAISATPVLETYGGASGEPVIGLEGDLSVDEVANAVTVRYTPRSEISTGVVAKITNTIKVPGRWGSQTSDPNKDKSWYSNGHPIGDPGQLVITLPYTDPATGQRIGAKDVLNPVKTTDWTANEAQDGTGYDYTNYQPPQLFFTIAPKATGVDVHIKNTALGILYIQTLQLRGTAIHRYDAQVITKEDPTSIALYGRNAKQITLPLEADGNFAEAIAEYELSRYTDPLWRPKKVSWRNLLQDKAGNKVLAAELGDTMRLHEFQTMSSLNQIQVRVVGITYKFGLKNDFSAEFDIEVAEDKNYGIYDRSLTLWDGCYYTI